MSSLASQSDAADIRAAEGVAKLARLLCCECSFDWNGLAISPAQELVSLRKRFGGDFISSSASQSDSNGTGACLFLDSVSVAGGVRLGGFWWGGRREGEGDNSRSDKVSPRKVRGFDARASHVALAVKGASV